MAEEPFTGEDVEHAVERLKANYYGGDNDYHGLDIDDLDEIVRLVLTSMWERGRLQADPKSVRHCTCGVRLDPALCGARGMACMGDGEGMPHSPGCRLPADHEGDHSWQRREPVGADLLENRDGQSFFDRRAAADPSVDHASHSTGWVGGCAECPQDQAAVVGGQPEQKETTE